MNIFPPCVMCNEMNLLHISGSELVHRRSLFLFRICYMFHQENEYPRGYPTIPRNKYVLFVDPYVMVNVAFCFVGVGWS